MRSVPAAGVVRAVALASVLMGGVPARAGVGDLLVAPTRLVIDNSRGTEVVLNNIGADLANYRVSLELRRMDSEGCLLDVPEASQTAHEKQTLELITYAPRRVALPPNQPQAIRVGVRPPADLPDGEYRAHLLFRAIPDAKPLTAQGDSRTLSVQLIPIYGVLIPVIIRKGNLTVAATVSDIHLGQMPPPCPETGTPDAAVGKVRAPQPLKVDAPALVLTMKRTGNRSVYGNIRVYHPGDPKPIYAVNGIATYAELDQRQVYLPITPEQKTILHGPVTVEYREPDDLGGGLIASAQAELP